MTGLDICYLACITLWVVVVLMFVTVLYRNEAVYAARTRFLDLPGLAPVTALQRIPYKKQLLSFSIWTRQGFYNQLLDSLYD